MKKIFCKKSFIMALTITLGASCLLTGCGKDNNKKTTDNQSVSSDATGWDMADNIVKDVEANAPVFDDYEVSIVDFGAEINSDKITDKAKESETAKKNSEAIKKAIEDVSKHTGDNDKVGGTVVIPKGYVYTGAIHLEDNVNLHLEDDAYLMFTTDYSQYENVLTRWEGVECYNYSPMIYAYQKKNIAITGNGIVDAQATKEEYWLPWKNTKYLPKETQDEDRKALFKMGEDGTDVKDRVFGEGHYLRPSCVQTFECDNVLIEGITVNNAPFWMVHPVLSNYVTIKNVTVESDGYNNDGINPDSCKNVVVDSCTFKTGDDCVAIKSGRNNDGRTVGVPCENVVVQNNTYVTGKGACVTIGSEMSGDVKNIFYRDNKSESTVEHLQAISIKTNGDRGGTVEGIYIKGITAANTEDRAVLITMFYEEGDTEVTTPVIKDVFIEDCDFKCEKPDNEKDVISIWGYSRSPIQNVQFKNCTFEGSEYALNLHNVDSIKFEGCSVNGKALPEGDFNPEENISLINPQISGGTISFGYTCGANEEDIKTKFVVSDSKDGQYSDVANTPEKEQYFNTLSSSGSEVKLTKIDMSKYYKFVVEVNGTTWESDVFHLDSTN